MNNFRVKDFDFKNELEIYTYKNIPIYKIDDMLVDVSLNYHGSILSQNIKCTLFIKSKKCFQTIDCPPPYYDDIIFQKLLDMEVLCINEYREITDNEYEQIKNNVKNILNNIKFCKFVGEFIINNKEDFEDIQDIDEMIGNNPLIEKTYNDCCICYEKTMTRLLCCGGSICIKCWSNIKPKNMNFILCPLCRNIINTNRLSSFIS